MFQSKKCLYQGQVSNDKSPVKRKKNSSCIYKPFDLEISVVRRLNVSIDQTKSRYHRVPRGSRLVLVSYIYVVAIHSIT